MINLPALASKTFNRLKDHKDFFQITKSIIKRLRKINSPIKRAKYVHREIDDALQEVLKEKLVKDLISCKKSCTFCCHTQVSVTSDEAELLAQKVIGGVEIDINRLYLQQSVQNNSEAFFQLKFQDRKCVFLNNAGECSVYENRPSVCRTNYVLSEPKNCDTQDGNIKPMRMLNTEKADMIIIGAYSNSKENGTLPFLLWKALHEKTNKLVD